MENNNTKFTKKKIEHDDTEIPKKSCDHNELPRRNGCDGCVICIKIEYLFLHQLLKMQLFIVSYCDFRYHDS